MRFLLQALLKNWNKRLLSSHFSIFLVDQPAFAINCCASITQAATPGHNGAAGRRCDHAVGLDKGRWFESRRDQNGGQLAGRIRHRHAVHWSADRAVARPAARGHVRCGKPFAQCPCRPRACRTCSAWRHPWRFRPARVRHTPARCAHARPLRLLSSGRQFRCAAGHRRRLPDTALGSATTHATGLPRARQSAAPRPPRPRTSPGTRLTEHLPAPLARAISTCAWNNHELELRERCGACWCPAA